MICPVCSEEMLILEFEGVELDFCARCGGVWLDEGELEQLAHDSGDFWRMPPGGRRSRRRCPRCNRRMRLAIYPGTGIEVDVCARGHGIWFDGGELQEVLRRGGAEGVARLLQDFLGGIAAQRPAPAEKEAAE